MSASRLEITFTEDLPLGAHLGFEGLNDGGQFSQEINTTYHFAFVFHRSHNFQVPIGMPTGIAGERNAINFANAAIFDTPFEVTRIGNMVRLEAVNVYSFTQFFVNSPSAPYINHPSIRFNLLNGSNTDFQISDYSFLPADSDNCNKIKISITTNDLAKKMLSPIVIENNAVNPIVFEWFRGQNIDVVLQNENEQNLSATINTPALLNLNAPFLDLQINPSPNGATVVAAMQPQNALTYEYSLDDQIWQSNNVFNGLFAGDYTIYIKDNFGCKKQLDFNINEFGIQSAYFRIFKENSIRFANRIEFGDSENYKNDENTLSCEVDVPLAYTQYQMFQSADIITTQFRSNFEQNIMKVLRENGDEINIPVEKKTNYIGRKDKRDARKYRLQDGKTAVYFTSGNIYDFDTNAVSGNHSLNGLLPEWVRVGNYMQIDNAWFLIESTAFDEVRNSEIIIIGSNYNGIETNTIVGSIYNLYNFEVYESEIDMVNYINEIFRVQIQAINPNQTITQLSEKITCKVRHENTVEINYWNSTNTNILYSTGIKHKIRIPLIKTSGKTDEAIEIHKTDTNSILLDAELYEADEFLFEPVTKEIWRKIMIALTHEKITINGVGYIRSSAFSTEGPLQESNLYVLTATMLKTGNVYNSITSGSTDFGESDIEIPGFIDANGGFIRYN